uniref:Reverse transcriptase domain-containing protein n=1 Tax=Arundo donax TaxID=35708 RepID=A0A0A9B3Y8_ARUDO
MKILLYLYEGMLGLKINFQKCEILMIQNDELKTVEYADMFNYAIGSWPLKYLGVPFSGSKLHVVDWIPMDEKQLKRLDGWQGGSLTIAGRTTLINSSLSSVPIYHMSMYLLPKIIHEKMDKTRRRFFWRGGEDKKEIPSG